jgi:PII-like signaling protein
MTLQRRSVRRLTIFLGECDTYRHGSLACEIVHRAHAAGLPGTSVFRGVEGFGASRVIHTIRFLSFADDLPIMVVIVADRAAVDDFVSEIAPLLRNALVIEEDVEAVGPTTRTGPPPVEHAVAG